MTKAAGPPGPGVTRQRAVAWLLTRCPVTELEADRALDYAVTDEAAAADAYTVTWDPETGFAIWPPDQPYNVIPASGPEAEAMIEATRHARHRAGQIIAARGRASPPAAQSALAAEADTALEEAVRSYRDGDGLVTFDQAAWLSVTLADTRVLNRAWIRMNPALRDTHQLLWSDVTRLARPGYAAAPACLLAFAALQSSNWHIAGAALDRALADHPGYPAATLLSAARAAELPASRYTPGRLPRPTSHRRAGTHAARRTPGSPELEPLPRSCRWLGR